MGRFSFKKALLLFLDVWGIGNRSMFRSLRDLMFRPGYMIRGYLRGMQSAYLNDGVGDAFPTFLAVKYLGLIGIVSLYEIIMLVLMCIDSQVGFNKYGDSPKYPEADNRPL